MIAYSIEKDLGTEEFIDVLKRSTLAERRPVDEPERIQNMLRHGNLVITARYNGRLVGVARSLSDFTYCTYLSDLAVDVEFQKQGIGRALIQHTRQAAPDATLILLAAPKAVEYYPRIGMTRFDQCYLLKKA